MANNDNNKKKRANRVILSRTLLLMIMCGVLSFIVLGAKLYTIQIRDHDMYEEMAVEQQTRETKVSASRGTIYDRNMNILAMSASAETVYINPHQIKTAGENINLIATGLSDILGVSYDSIVEKAKDTNSYYKTIATKIEEAPADQVREFINQYDLSGIVIVPDVKRYYPYSTLASNIIGFVGTDNYGLEGLEAYYEETLKGSSGTIVTATNAEGTSLLYSYENFLDAAEGNSAVLSIDSTVQYYLEKHLQAAVDEYDVQNGAFAIAMDVNTGAILGMASLPNYDLNNFTDVYSEELSAELNSILSAEGEYATYTEEERNSEYRTKYSEALTEQYKNRTVTDTYEPGSTFKMFTLAMAVEEGLVSDGEGFYCGGSVEVPGRDTPVNCWRTWGHGSQTLVQALQHSCNVAFVNIGLRVGAQSFYKYCEAFGFFEKTGVDMPGESSSLWWSEADFTNGNLSSLAAASFGQTFNITPIQLITAVSAIANGGYLMEPYIVQSVLDADGNVISNTEPTVVRQVISEETSKKVCEMLERVVSDSTEGTGKNAFIAGYRIAGKTGTSTDTKKEAETGEKKYMVSFVGFAPADDPQIAVLVVLDSPNPETAFVSGGVMAAPTVRGVFEDILPYLGIEPSYTAEELELIDISVPKVTGASVTEAAALLSDKSFKYTVIGDGDKVTDQIPSANATVHSGSTVIIYCGTEKPQDEVVVPDVTGLSKNEAKERLENAGLYMRSVGTSSTLTSVTARSQSAEPYNTVKYGSVIEVTFVDNSIQD